MKLFIKSTSKVKGTMGRSFYLLMVLYFGLSRWALGQNAVAAFDSSSPYCLEELAILDNTSTDAVSFEWDFCGGEFSTAPVEQALGSLSGVTRANAMSLAFDQAADSYVLMGANFTNGSLFRVLLGDSLGSGFTQDPVTVTAGSLSLPDGMDLIQNSDGDWYGFVGSASSSGGISRLDFGNSLLNDVTITSLGNFDQGTNLLRDVKVVVEDGDYILVILNYTSERLVRINYGNSLLNVPTDTVESAAISGLVNAGGMDFIEKEGTIFGYISSISGTDFVKLDLGNSILNEPALEETYSIAGLSSPFKVNIEQVGDRYYCLLTDVSAGMKTLDLGDLSLGEPIVDLGYTLSQSYGVVGNYDRGNYRYYGINGSSLNLIPFDSDCGASVATSTDEDATVSYAVSGSPIVRLTATGANGISSTFSETLTISTDQAPDIDFTIDASRCIDNANTFASVNNSGDIASYSWDFDGDGLEDSTEPNPTFQFPATGTYEVSLIVATSAGCGNQVARSITLYDPPPSASFDVIGSNFCIGDNILFSNLTSAAGLEDIVTYLWDFNGEGTSTLADPVFAFSSAGTKTITLQALIPGCSSEAISREVLVNVPPDIDFDFTRVCEGEQTSFFDVSPSTDLESYFWDFGDGFTSNIENPRHTFASNGLFTVSYTATNSLGCSVTVEKEVAIGQIPEPVVSITGDIACDQTVLQFNDLTNSAISNIVSQTWEIEGFETKTGPSVEFTFSEPGDYRLFFTVANESNCTATLDTLITVEPSPLARFETEVGCVGSPTQFNDITDSNIQSWFWIINGQEFFTANPLVVFEESGTYDVTMEVTSENFCVSSVTQQIEIAPLPVAAFSFEANCANEQVRFADASQQFSDPVVSWLWNFGDGAFANGEVAFHQYGQAGQYQVSLSILTDQGCSLTTSRLITVEAAPVAGFSIDTDFGTPPFTVTATDQSTGGSRIAWFLNDQFIALDDPSNPSFEIESNGVFEIKQLVINDDTGCRDSATVNIESSIPAYDLILNDVGVIDNDGDKSIVVSVINNSSLPVADFNIELLLDNEVIFGERYSGILRQQEEVIYRLQSLIPEQNLDFVCVRISLVVDDFEDVDLSNNEDCRNFATSVKVSESYPNPATDQAVIKVIFDEPETFNLTFTDLYGNVLFKSTYPEITDETRTLTFDLNGLSRGLYLAVFDFKDRTEVRRILKR
ncbi:MAG: PKD domain-containing protein [Bacteroidota bacterium]